MLVQLTPWKSSQTSVKLPKTSRRRKRDEEDVNQCMVDASFVTTASRRGQQKWKQHSSEFSESMPLLTITGDHRVTVIGKTKEPSYAEFSSLQYSSRPGGAGSFFPHDGNEKAGGTDPRIPAILDAKNDRVYALQHGNLRLCCWHALEASGPEELAALKVPLSNPALSMALLPLHKGVIYGTCKDGQIFVARVATQLEKGNPLSVEYIPSSPPPGSKHIGTMAQLPQGQLRPAGRKRKMSDVDGNTSVTFVQAYQHGDSVCLLRHEVLFDRTAVDGELIVNASLSQQTASVSLGLGVERKLVDADLLVSSSGSSPKVAVFYRTTTASDKGSRSTQSHCSLVSLEDGDASHGTVALPQDTQQCGLATETILAVATTKSVFLYDLETGASLLSSEIPDSCSGNTNWILKTDAKFGIVAFLHPSDGRIQVSISAVVSDADHETNLSTLKLSSKIASSMGVASMHPGRGAASTMDLVGNLLTVGTSSVKEVNSTESLQDTVKKALESLEGALVKLKSSKEDVKDYIFLNTYEVAVASVLGKVTVDHNSGQPNPQDNASKPSGQNGTMNALNGNETSKSSLNGLRGSSMARIRAPTPVVLPQGFIDGAVRVAVALLTTEKVADPALGRRIGLARLDARLILSRLLQTGKVSARLSFDQFQDSQDGPALMSVLRSLKLSNKRGRRVFSPVDMIHDMLRCCPDVSEREMVTMMHYMLSRSLPDDIAEVFMEDKKLSVQHRYKILTRKYFEIRNAQPRTASKAEEGADKSDPFVKISRKLILAGSTYVLYRIMCYSQVNEAMLRVALLEGMGGSDAVLLGRLLSEVLSYTAKDLLARGQANSNVVVSTCQWISVLCDCYQDELSSTRTVGGESYLDSLRQSVGLAAKQSQTVISLKETVRRAEKAIATKASNKVSLEGRKSSGGEEVPAYSINRLVF